MGSQTKNTLCFAEGSYAYLSPVHADLAVPKDLAAFEKDARAFLKQGPKIIACDLHPEYQSTKYALALPKGNYCLRHIQHHHAHIAACMAENGLKPQKVIGVAFDGTGLGDDGALWGGEFLISDYTGFLRKANLKPVPLLGGEMAIKEPWRTACFWLFQAYQEKFWDLKIDFLRGLDRKKWRVLKQLYESGFNCPLSSSMGRLFDAAASMIISRHKAVHEAELAVGLEKLAQTHPNCPAGYKFKFVQDQDWYIIDPLPMFKEMVEDLASRGSLAGIAYKLHSGIAEMISGVCQKISRETGIKQAVLSGGVFQNKLLVSLSSGLLFRQGFKVLIGKELLSTDMNISLGQAAIAGAV